MNQCKRLSDCPAERLAQCRGEPVPPAGDVECAICLSLGDQCVTCEESEFKAWAEKHFASPDYSQTSAGVYIKDWMRHSFAAWQARSKVVTRLTAERDRLQGDKDRAEATLKRSVMVEDFEALTAERDELKSSEELLRAELAWSENDCRDLMKERDGLLAEAASIKKVSRAFSEIFDSVVNERDALQSELTKARESSPINWTDRQVLDFLGVALRNVDLVGEVRLSEIRQGFQYMQERLTGQATDTNSVTKTIDPYMAAPAPKGGE